MQYFAKEKRKLSSTACMLQKLSKIKIQVMCYSLIYVQVICKTKKKKKIPILKSVRRLIRSKRVTFLAADRPQYFTISITGFKKHRNLPVGSTVYMYFLGVVKLCSVYPFS